MRRLLAFIGAGISAFAVVGSAAADIGTARACAVALLAEAKTIYDAAAPELVQAADPRALVKAKIIDLVKSRGLDREGARSNAIATGDCLRKLS